MSDPADLPRHAPGDAGRVDPFASGADALRVEGLGSAHVSADPAAVVAGTNGTTSVNGSGTLAGSGSTNGHGVVNGAGVVSGAGVVADQASDAPAADKVIDLREAGTTRVRVSKDANPFNTLSKQERMRLIVRILCEIVAYGELEEDDAPDEPTTAPAVAEPPVADLPISNN